MPTPTINPTTPAHKRRARPGEGRRWIEQVAFTYQGDECLIWPFGTSNGYGMVYNSAIEQNEHVHRVVCEHRHGPAPTPEHEAAHGCGNGGIGCCNQMHLRWATFAENRQDMIDHGRSMRGQKSHFAKLRPDQVRKIRALKGKQKQRDTAKRYGISQPAVGYIQRGENWGWLV